MSLALLLAKKRRVMYRLCQPSLTVRLVLGWADRHYNRTGSWPNHMSGRIVGGRGETWGMVHAALYRGGRGLPGGSSLADFLLKHRGVRNLRNLPPFTEEQILEWADEHFRQSGEWPSGDSGPIKNTTGETWRAVDQALYVGLRGLAGGSSLTRLLVERRGIRNRNHPPKLSVTRIFAWADAWHSRTGKWPAVRAGGIPEAPGETWRAVHQALYVGLRGLKGGSSLSKLLSKKRGVRNSAMT